MNLLSIDEVAIQLGISKASVKNWEKQEYIKPLHDKKYLEDDVIRLKEKIETGEIKRLSSRANKSKSKSQFIPTEYIGNNESLKDLESIISFILEYNIKPEQALFLLSVNALKQNNDIHGNVYEALSFVNTKLFKRQSVHLLLKKWFNSIHNGEIKEDNKYCKFLLEAPLPKERDVLGIIYQSIINEGKKSALGSYYTPNSLVKEIVKDNPLKEGKVLDPCCGTGQFLLEMSSNITDPNKIWGADIDGIATQIASINLLLQYEEDFTPNIYNRNSLLNWSEKDFSLITTNPPWGAKIDKKDLKELKLTYKSIESKESFSFFLSFAVKYLKEGGRYSFVLPESVLYVKNHQDIRSFLLNNTTITKIESCGRMFKNVFSSVVRVDGIKQIPKKDSKTTIHVNDASYQIKQGRFTTNKNYIMDIYCSEKDQEIIDSIYSKKYTTLKNSGLWALGVVTGNNSLYISDVQKENMEPIYKGKDLEPLKFKIASNFINFKPDLFQQCAPIKLYRTNEKLVYKFISNKLVFAYDNKKSITLNSANILIPQLDNYSVKTVAAILNSSIYNFIFKKKFNALKILRGDIETLPFPEITNSFDSEISNLVDRVLNNDATFIDIDEKLYTFFNVNDETKKYILDFL